MTPCDLTPGRFDKLQMIVCQNGTASVNFEHTAVDGGSPPLAPPPNTAHSTAEPFCHRSGHTVLRLVSDVFADTIIRFAQSITSTIHGKVCGGPLDLATTNGLNTFVCPELHFLDFGLRDRRHLQRLSLAIALSPADLHTPSAHRTAFRLRERRCAHDLGANQTRVCHYTPTHAARKYWRWRLIPSLALAR